MLLSRVRAAVPRRGAPPPVIEFSRRARIAFGFRYALLKTVDLPREVRTPRLRLFVYEMVYSLCRACGRDPLRLRFLRITRIESIFGIFHVRPGTLDVACASPAFERADVDRLLRELCRAAHAGREIVFIDGGADIGTYSVTVGNHLGPGVRARILAFEPSTASAALLRRNVAANRLDAVVDVRRRALGDGSVATATLTFDTAEPGCSGLDPAALNVHAGRVVRETVAVSTLDHELRDVPQLDLLVIKLDVEGSEVAVLDGAAGSIRRAREVLLLVEDFVDARIVARLHADGWRFVAKLTPYNSFWRLGDEAGEAKAVA